jgi:predicted RND superfamily exporter protein
MLLSPISPVSKQFVRLDPLGFRSLFGHLVENRGSNLKLKFREGYLFSQDFSLLLMIVKPVEPAQDVLFTRQLMTAVREMADICKKELIEEGEDLGGISIGFTGGYAFVVENESILKKDVLMTLVTASIGITLLFMFAFRSVGAVFYVGFPLLAGLSWTAGFAALTVGSINLFTGASATVLIGLEVDFAIHLLSRYREERGRGLGVEQALVETLRHTGVGVLTAASTSIAAFFAALTAQFRGLVQLGLICGTGMILCLAANLILIPAVLVVATRWNVEPKKEREPMNFGLEWLAGKVKAHAGLVIALGLLATLVLGRYALLTRMESSFKNLKPPDSPAVLLQKQVIAAIGSPLVYTMVLNRAATEDEALAEAEAIAGQLDPLVEDGTLVFFNSIRSLIPPVEVQQRNLQWLDRRRKENPQGYDVGRILRTLGRAMREEGFRDDPEVLQETAGFLEAALGITDPLTMTELLDTPLGPRLARFIHASDSGFEVITYAYQGGGQGVHVVNNRIRQALEGITSSAEVVGVGVLGEEIRRLLRRDGIVVTAIATVAVLLLVYADSRKWKYVFYAAVPVVAGIVWTLGIMELTGIPFNIVNVAILPILVGIGVDDGIHIVHRFLEGGGRVVPIFHHTGRAVLITTVTTMVGFGTLVFADYPGLVTVGLVAIVGMICCFVASVTVLPALLIKTRRF